MITFLMTLLVSLPAFAIDFSQHPAPIQSITCKKLDYSSYFIAQNAESNLKKVNPDVSKPNFAGQYLLLRNEMLMETLWLVADCKTGKFFHENISGKQIEFKPDSTLIVLKKDLKTTEYQVWSGDSWVKMDASVAENPSSTSASPAPGALSTAMREIVLSQAGSFPQYDALFAKFPSPDRPNEKECKSLDYNSYFKAERAKENIQKINSQLNQANFAGKYLLVKNELLFETLVLIASCETGKFSPLTISGKPNFRRDSSLVLLKQSADFPQLFLWAEDQWMQIADPIQKGTQTIQNTLYGAKAKQLLSAIENAGKNDIVRFENLVCVDTKCTYDTHQKKALPIEPLIAKSLSSWVPLLGATVESGSCEVKRNETQCSLKSK